jgi:hypothetical protein
VTRVCETNQPAPCQPVAASRKAESSHKVDGAGPLGLLYTHCPHSRWAGPVTFMHFLHSNRSNLVGYF